MGVQLGMGWVGSWVHKFTWQWVGLDLYVCGLGWVVGYENGPMDNSGTSLPWPSTGVSGIKHRRTSPTIAFQCPMLPVAGTCDPPAAINWLFHVSAAAPSVVAPSLLPVSTDSENSLTVCLLLAFRWLCVRGVFTYSRYTNVHLLTYLLICTKCNSEPIIVNQIRPIRSDGESCMHNVQSN